MKTVGIVAEYNPFHGGHLYQMAKAKALTGAEAVVCVMSGDFVQRGSAAVYDKFARAQAAVHCGASLVLELPLPWCISSAEGFARGGVGLLGAAGVVDCLSFGSECGDAVVLTELASALEQADGSDVLRKALDTGASFAAAREQAVEALLGAEKAALLHRPNNILAVEYIRALRGLNHTMELCPVLREGSVHDGPGSASELRAMLERGEDVLPLLPPGAAAVYERVHREGKGPVLPAQLEQALLARLRMLSFESFARLPDAGEGLENLLYRAVREEGSLEAAAARCKSRRYALSRIRRMLLCAALGLERGMADGIPPYLRVLAADRRGCELLAEMRKKAELPVISKAAAVRELSGEVQNIFELGSRAHDLWVLGRSCAGLRQGDEDFRRSPVIFC